MTDYVANQSGDWSTTTIWTPNGTPGDGDTIRTNGFDVVVDSNRTIGESQAEGSGTWVVDIDGGGSLQIASGVTLTMRGDGRNSNGTLIIGENGVGGGVLEFDSSQATSPTSQNYVFNLITNFGDANYRLEIHGTSGNRSTVRSNASGGTGYFARNSTYKTNIECKFCDFEDINDPATNLAFDHYFWDDDATSQPFIFEDCTFDAGCGQVGADLGLAANNTYILRRCTFLNVAGTYANGLFGSTDIGGSGTREIDDCYFEDQASLRCPGFSIKGTLYGTVFAAGYASALADFDQYDDVLVRISAQTGVPMSNGQANRGYFIHTNGNNPHFLSGDSTASTSMILADFVFDLDDTQTGDTGDVVAANNFNPTLTIQGCICLPDNAGKAAFTLLSCLGYSGQAIAVNHNTGPASSATGLVNVGETYNSHAGQISSLRSNICWNPSQTDLGYIITTLNGAPNDDVVSAANADYNCLYNIDDAGGDPGGGYDTPVSSGTPGTNDLDEDPTFVDATRDSKAFDSDNGGPGTVANLFAELAKMNTAAHDSAYTAKNLTTWVRAGFVVQAANLENAGHDAATIGAMPYQAAGPVITDVDTDETWTDGDTGLVITGTGFS